MTKTHGGVLWKRLVEYCQPQIDKDCLPQVPKTFWTIETLIFERIQRP